MEDTIKIIIGTATFMSAIWGFFYYKHIALKNEQIKILTMKASGAANTKFLSNSTVTKLKQELSNVTVKHTSIQVQAGNPAGEKLALQFKNIFEHVNWNPSYEKSSPVNSFAKLVITVSKDRPDLQNIFQNVLDELDMPDCLKHTNLDIVNVLVGDSYN